MMESDRWQNGMYKINIFREGNELTDTQISYSPKTRDNSELAAMISGHGGSDFYTMHYFLQKVLGRESGEESIDVYTALDMSIPGLLAYRSICSGNIPMEVPDFRDKEAREKYRDDNWCTDPKVAGSNMAPYCSFGSPEIPDSVYEKVKAQWEAMNK
jgi:hypothetical protein